MSEANPFERKPVKSTLEKVVRGASDAISHTVSEVQSWRAKKRAEELAIKDNPKIKKELRTGSRRIGEKFRYLKQKQYELNRKSNKNKDVSQEKPFSIDESLINELKNLLQDYKVLGNDSRWAEHSFYLPARLVSIFIENMLEHGDLEGALDLWNIAPDDMLSVGENIARQIASNTFIDKPKKSEDTLLKRFEGHPDLYVAWIYQYNTPREFSKISLEKRLDLFKQLLNWPERHSFLKYFSGSLWDDDINKNIASLISPEDKEKLFNIYIEKYPKGVFDNFNFFKDNFEKIDPNRRSKIVETLGEDIGMYYSLGTLRATDGKGGRYEPSFHFNSDHINPVGFLSKIKITKAEQRVIFAAFGQDLNSRPSDATGPISFQFKESLLLHHNFILDMAKQCPEVLFRNGDVLIGYPTPSETDQKGAFIENIIRTGRNDIVCELLKRNFTQEKIFTHDEFTEVCRYSIDNNIREITNILAKYPSQILRNPDLGNSFIHQLIADNNPDHVLTFIKSGGIEDMKMLDQAYVIPMSLLAEYVMSNVKEGIPLLVEHIEKITSINPSVAIQVLFHIVSNKNTEAMRIFAGKLDLVSELPLTPEIQSGLLAFFLEDVLALPVMLESKMSSFVFSSLDIETREKIGKRAIHQNGELILEKLITKIIPSLDPAVELGPIVSAIRDYTERTKIAHCPTARKYVELHLNQGREEADQFLDNLEKNAEALIGQELPLDQRKCAEYRYQVEFVFPAGNYSSHRQNLACGDKLEHLKGYDYDKEGYPVTLSGLLGYRLKEGETEYRTLLTQYQQRLEAIRGFVASRGPDNNLLQEAFNKKIDDFFERYADSNFQSIANLSTKEKMVVLFITEALRKEQEADFSPNQQVLDLIVEYKYAYHENLEAYVQRSAHDVGQYRDEASQRFLLLQELSNIYGENVKHVLRHNIFEDLAENGKNYSRIVEAFGSAISESSDSFEMSPREMQSVENIFNKELSAEQTHDLVVEKLADIYGPQDKSKDDEDKKRAYEAERREFVDRIKAIIPSDLQELNADIIGERLAQAFTIHPKHMRRFENTFDNPQIPKDGKFKVLSKQVIDIFGSNIRFGNEEERENFEQAATEILESLRKNLDKKVFLGLVSKLRTLRSQYRFGINRKLEELFSLDLNAINREVAKFEEVPEVEAKETRIGGEKENVVKKSSKGRKIRTFITKTQETANARMGAYLCISGDGTMWENPNYFEAVDKNEDTGKCVGLTMYLRIDAPKGKKYLWIGPNPFESFLTQVSAEKALDHQYKVAVDFSSRNGFDGVVIPAEEGQILGACTNRGGNFPDLIKAKRLRDKKGELSIVDFGGEHKLGGGYGYSKGALIWQK